MRQEVGAREETEIIEKGGMVVWEIGVGEDPTNPAHVHVGIVPVHKNHADAEVNFIPENHVNVGTVLIFENRVNVGTIHVHASMLTEVQIPQRSDVPTMQLCML